MVAVVAVAARCEWQRSCSDYSSNSSDVATTCTGDIAQIFLIIFHSIRADIASSAVCVIVMIDIAGPGMNPPHVDTILVKNYYEFFSENLGIDSTRDGYMQSFFA